MMIDLPQFYKCESFNIDLSVRSTGSVCRSTPPVVLCCVVTSAYQEDKESIRSCLIFACATHRLAWFGGVVGGCDTIV